MMEQSKGNIHCTPDYGGQNAINGRKCRLWGYTDATGAVEYSYGDMGEIMPNASAVMESATTSRSEKVGTTPRRGTFPLSFT